MYEKPHSVPKITESRVASPLVFCGSGRSARHQQKNVQHIAVSAIDSLSYPPPTERMMCAGRIAMISAAAAPETYDCVHSPVRSPRKTVAEMPNHAGTKQQTSLRLIGRLK